MDAGFVTAYRITRQIPGVTNPLQVGKRTYPSRDAAETALRAMTGRDAVGCRVGAIDG